MEKNKLNKTIEEKLNSGREYRNMELREVEAEEGNTYIVEGYATTYNQDYLLFSIDEYDVYERVNKDAFKSCDMKDVIFQYNHEGRVYARNSNGTLTLTSDDHGLKVRANLGGTEIGKQLYEEIKGGYTNKMSFGFIVDKEEVTYTDTEDKRVRVTREILGISKLFDVSAVSIPANDYTSISARQFSEGVINGLKEEFQAKEERRRKIEEIKKLCEGE